MPDVRLPDGTVVRNVPEGTTRSQLMARLQKAKPQSRGILGGIADVVDSVNENAIGLVQGTVNAASAVTDALASPFVDKDTVRGVQNARQAAFDGTADALTTRRNPAARTTGQIVGTAASPLGKIGWLGQIPKIGKGAVRAVQGAWGGAGVRDSNQSAAAPAAIGAAANVILPPALSKLAQSRPVQAAGRAAGAAASRALPGVFGVAPKPLSAPLAPLGPKAQERAANFKAVGVTRPTAGMVSRHPNAFTGERKLAKIDDDLAAQFQQVEQDLADAGSRLVERMGGKKTAEEVGKGSSDFLAAKNDEMRRATSRIYDDVRETRGDEIVGPLDTLTRMMRSPDVTDNAVFDGMRESLSRRMARLGLKDEGAPSPENFTLRDVAPATPGADDAGRFKKTKAASNEFRELGTRKIPTAKGRHLSVRGPLDITQSIRMMGGVKDTGGDLASMGIGNKSRRLDFGGNERQLGKVIDNENGVPLDDATERLWEEGYFPEFGSERPTINDLLAKMDDEARGIKRYFHPSDAEEVARFQSAQADRYKLKKAADDGAPFVEDASRPAGPDDRQPPWAEYETEAAAVPRGVTVRQAEELRKFIGSLGSVTEPSVRMMRGKLIDALDDDVVSSVGDDAFKGARASAKAGYEEFKKTVAGKIAQEGITAEKLTQRLLSMPLKDLKAVRKSHLSGTPDQIARGRSVWKGLQSQQVSDWLETAVSEEGGVNGRLLLKNFNKRSDHLRIILDPADYDAARSLAVASRDATMAPPASSAYGSDTAPWMANLFKDAKPQVKQGWVKLLTKHGLVAAASAPMGAFPYANLAIGVGEQAVAGAAQQKAASALVQRVQMAQNPEAYAAAVSEAQSAAASNAAIAEFFNKAGLGRLIGGTAASTQQPSPIGPR